ncbi:MAG: YbaN family protein [Methanosarcinales archaeon]|nr:YbaN family protein [Methanosarcinales archaeon]
MSVSTTRSKDKTEDDYCPGMMSNRLTRGILVIAGTIFTGLGLLGILLPLLPTTPFLLLAVACYARSSKRFYCWLLNNKWFGTYIRDYREGKGITLKVKVYVISLLWFTMLFSIIFIVQNLLVSSILVLLALGVTVHLVTIRTLKE